MPLEDWQRLYELNRLREQDSFISYSTFYMQQLLKRLEVNEEDFIKDAIDY